MPAPLYTEVCGTVRIFLNDLSVPGGATYSDAYLQGFIESAQLTMVNYLLSNSVEILKFRTETPLTIPAGTTILDRPLAYGGTAGTGVALLLPKDFLEPEELLEAKVGGANEDFVPMAGPWTLPLIGQIDTLRYWDWRGGQIHLLGATEDRLLRIYYWSSLGNLDPTARMKVSASGNALAAIAAALAARSKGQQDVADRLAVFNADGTIGGQAGWELQQIINADVKTQQSVPTRRVSRAGYNRYPNRTNYFSRRG